LPSLQIYNETIRDLLLNVRATGKDSKDKKKLQMRMREDGNRSADASKVSVYCAEVRGLSEGTHEMNLQSQNVLRTCSRHKAFEIGSPTRERKIKNLILEKLGSSDWM
jgi:hypothetical protein